MPFDSNLTFHDGTAITATVTPTSTTRTSGSAALDVGTGGLPADGMSVVMIMQNDLEAASDTLIVTIERCATVDGTYQEVATFPTHTYGDGAQTRIIRVGSHQRYLRALLTISDASGSGYTVSGVYIYLVPHAFKYL